MRVRLRQKRMHSGFSLVEVIIVVLVLGIVAATIDFYNRVNSSEETDLGNYGGGGYL